MKRLKEKKEERVTAASLDNLQSKYFKSGYLWGGIDVILMGISGFMRKRGFWPTILLSSLALGNVHCE